MSHAGKPSRLQTERDLVLVLRYAPQAYADLEVALEQRYCDIVRGVLATTTDPPPDPKALLREFVTMIKDQSEACKILDPIANGGRQFWPQISSHLQAFLCAKLLHVDIAGAFRTVSLKEMVIPESNSWDWASDMEVARILRDAPEAYDRFAQLLEGYRGYVYWLFSGHERDPAWDAGAIIQDFHNKALTPGKAEKIFGPVLAGACSLQTIVFACLRNRVTDILRRPKVGTVEDVVDVADRQGRVEATDARSKEEVVGAEATERTNEPDSRLSKLLRERVCVLQEAKTWLVECRAPYYQSLLLSERVTLANQGGEALEDGASAAAFAEQCVPWVLADGGLAFGAGKPTLEETWLRLRTRVEQRESIQSSDIATVLDIASNRFDQWVSRARHMVVESVLGRDWTMAQELFSHW